MQYDLYLISEVAHFDHCTLCDREEFTDDVGELAEYLALYLTEEHDYLYKHKEMSLCAECVARHS